MSWPITIKLIVQINKQRPVVIEYMYVGAVTEMAEHGNDWVGAGG